jgi:prepilin-type N-terminal cleavage/methylation domain-containing protein
VNKIKAPSSLKRYVANGFTLVELLIVVIILAILAAIVVPQFASTTDDAKLASVDSTLSNVRAAIDLYYQQHGAYPGSITAVPSAACAGTSGTGVATGGAGATAVTAFQDQLGLYTDAKGGACSISDTTNHKFGPYMKKSTLPADPINNVATLTVVAAGNLNMTADGTTGGWKYDSKAGKFIMNHTAYQTR